MTLKLKIRPTATQQQFVCEWKRWKHKTASNDSETRCRGRRAKRKQTCFDEADGRCLKARGASAASHRVEMETAASLTEFGDRARFQIAHVDDEPDPARLTDLDDDDDAAALKFCDCVDPTPPGAHCSQLAALLSRTSQLRRHPLPPALRRAGGGRAAPLLPPRPPRALRHRPGRAPTPGRRGEHVSVCRYPFRPAPALAALAVSTRCASSTTARRGASNAPTPSSRSCTRTCRWRARPTRAVASGAAGVSCYAQCQLCEAASALPRRSSSRGLGGRVVSGADPPARRPGQRRRAHRFPTFPPLVSAAAGSLLDRIRLMRVRHP